MNVGVTIDPKYRFKVAILKSGTRLFSRSKSLDISTYIICFVNMSFLYSDVTIYNLLYRIYTISIPATNIPMK